MEEEGVSKIVAVRITGEALFDGETLVDIALNNNDSSDSVNQ